MKKIIDVDYAFYVAILFLAFCSASCEPEVTEVWPHEPHIEAPFNDSIDVPCDSSCLYTEKSS